MLEALARHSIIIAFAITCAYRIRLYYILHPLELLPFFFKVVILPILASKSLSLTIRPLSIISQNFLADRADSHD